MIEAIAAPKRLPRLVAAGLPPEAAQQFLSSLSAWEAATDLHAAPSSAMSLEADTAVVQAICRQGRELLGKLPLRSKRNAAGKDAGHAIVHLLALAYWRFFRRHAVALYSAITDRGRRSMRVGELAWEAAALLPGILPTEAELEEEGRLMQQDKDGLEIAQGVFFSHVLGDRRTGSHLIRSMMRPMPESMQRLEEFRRTGRADLGTVRVEVEGRTGYVYLHNERYLNSEDDTTVGPLETAIDLVLLHPEVRMGVLRGSVVDHPKHKGKRIFCSGINLTRIYQGKQSYLSFLYRQLGMHGKLYRGILPADDIDGLDAPLGEPEQTLEKLWVAVVETFAIGGGCQLLLVVDYVIAESGAYFSLPARKEGIIPGASNMRLPRYLGERIAREAIMFDRIFHADSAEGRLIANRVVQPGEIDQAVRDCVENAVDSGMISAGGNRKAMRVQTEPLELFRTYMSTYAVEQAFCHLSEQLVQNLERHWNAKARKL